MQNGLVGGMGRFMKFVYFSGKSCPKPSQTPSNTPRTSRTRRLTIFFGKSCPTLPNPPKPSLNRHVSYRRKTGNMYYVVVKNAKFLRQWIFFSVCYAWTKESDQSSDHLGYGHTHTYETPKSPLFQASSYRHQPVCGFALYDVDVSGAR